MTRQLQGNCVTYACVSNSAPTPFSAVPKMAIVRFRGAIRHSCFCRGAYGEDCRKIVVSVAWTRRLLYTGGNGRRGHVGWMKAGLGGDGEATSVGFPRRTLTSDAASHPLHMLLLPTTTTPIPKAKPRRPCDSVSIASILSTKLKASRGLSVYRPRTRKPALQWHQSGAA